MKCLGDRERSDVAASRRDGAVASRSSVRQQARIGCCLTGYACEMSEVRRQRGVSQERWALLTFDEQMANLGADVSRSVAALAAGKADRAEMWAEHARAEFEMTLGDGRWLAEREVVEDLRRRFEDTIAGRVAADPAPFDEVFYPHTVRANEARRARYERD